MTVCFRVDVNLRKNVTEHPRDFVGKPLLWRLQRSNLEQEFMAQSLTS